MRKKQNEIKISLVKNYKFRLNILKIFIILVYGLVLIRLFYMQVYNREEFIEKSKKNRIKIRRIEAPRGNIYDRNGKLLVKNIAGYRLVYLNGRRYNDEIVKNIAELLGISKESVIKKIKYGEIYTYTGENVLEQDLEIEKAHKIMEKISKYSYLDVISYSKRYYIYNDLASHVLGYIKPITEKEYEKLKDNPVYTKRSYTGKKGIEKQYDELLQGKDGYEYIEVNAYNKIVKKIKNAEVKPGSNLYLSIDYELQKYITDFLGNEKAAFLAMEAKTGKIITMVSSPEYSLNMFTSKFSTKDWNKLIKNPSRPLINRITGSTYPPGSIFKPLVAMSFLEQGIDKDYEIYDPGYYQIGKWKYRSWKRGGHGYTNMEKSIIESVNTYYYTMGDKIGHKPIIETASKFGLGKKTGIDLPDEKVGILPDKEWKKVHYGEGWYRGDTVNLSIGQGYLLVTPLQMLLAYDVLANNGIGYKPHILDKVIDSEGKVKNIEHEISILYNGKKEYFDTLREAMVQVVDSNHGTGRRLRRDFVKIAAKTGSAQNSMYSDTHAWAAGYFPADNPEIVFVSFVEGGGSGGAIATKAVNAFIDKYYENK
ncbi:penicillin-binding protein 2 [Hypnocyclicus thermotrophus]|nr:penicillin-binding protein 2 [Hypnocyclicus thermotrophus]